LAKRLLEFVSSRPPDLPQEVLDKLGATGGDDDPTSCLDADAFLARLRARAEDWQQSSSSPVLRPFARFPRSIAGYRVFSCTRRANA
jgi:hypothetical protein